MKVETLKKILKDSNTKIIKVGLKTGQDPFVLYPKRYNIKKMQFTCIEDLLEFFKDKNISAMDCEVTNNSYDVLVCVSNPEEDVRKMCRLKKKANGRSNN